MTIKSEKPETKPVTKEDEVVVGRVVAWGTYRLETAAHFGSGQTAETDMLLARAGDGSLFIPGSSLAGVCRSYLASFLLPDVSGKLPMLTFSDDYLAKLTEAERKEREREREVASLLTLFGAIEDEGNQSALLFQDAFALNPLVTVRDGVKIKAETGQAEDQFKYDLEVVRPGTTFEIRLELVIRRAYIGEQTRLKQLLNLLLAAFEQGEIRLGARTRRGLGLGRVEKWQVQDLDFRNPLHTLTWLRRDKPKNNAPSRAGENLSELKGGLAYFELIATFELSSSMLIRAYTEDLNRPDASQLTEIDPAEPAYLRPLVPGSSTAGVMRHRAERIANTLGVLNRDIAKEFINALFGFVEESDEKRKLPPRQQAGRLRVEESWLKNSVSEVQSRIKIDRLSGGVLSGFLFEEAPVWGSQARPASWQLRWRLSRPAKAEIGLLLQILKDMWVEPVSGSHHHWKFNSPDPQHLEELLFVESSSPVEWLEECNLELYRKFGGGV
ncbi:MAG: RAMP superfamily CRISPR-associated protein [Chloroflexota bacterium]